MIAGTGVDIIEIERIRQSMEKHGKDFLDRLFTSGEISYCSSKSDPSRHYAARFAAKEAYFKAIGTGWTNGISWKDVEVRNLPSGKPELEISGDFLNAITEEEKEPRVHLSLSHSRTFAVANVVIEQN